MKYQFCIRFTGSDINSAASKAVVDCNTILIEHGYRDYTFSVIGNSNKIRYYSALFKELLRFYFAIEGKSTVVIQYPLLSINNVFKYFIRLAKLKRIKFICIIHDLESLRGGGSDEKTVEHEIENLNYFDVVIAHNPAMIQWLTKNGLLSKSVSLDLFDYLVKDCSNKEDIPFNKVIVFAGNLIKSTFIYSLNQIKGWSFMIYGPNYKTPLNLTDSGLSDPRMRWCGEYSPDDIVTEMTGSFGLIWDGVHIDKCDEILGNYLNYNNPHKFSLYIAAGLPVIAPSGSAIGSFIKKHNLGLLVNNLLDLSDFKIDQYEYAVMKENVRLIRDKVVSGKYLEIALLSAEANI